MKADAVYHIETFKQVFRDAPFGVGVFDLQTGQSLFLNEAFYRIIEYTPEEYNAIISDDLSLLLYDQDKIITETIKKELQETGSVKNLEYRIIKKNKGISTIQVSIVIIHLDGRTCAFCYFEDVTSEREYLEHFKLIAENTDSSISLLRLNVKDKTIKLIFANDIFFKMAGGSREKYTADPESLLSLVPEEDQNNTVEAIRRSILTGKPQELEYRLYQPDHTSRWMNRHLSAIKQDEENTYLLSSIVTDITDLKQSELQIKLEQQNYQNILDNMPTGFAKIRVNPDGSSTVILVNQAFCKMIDMSYQQCMELYQDSCLAGIHPDDLEHTVEVMSGIHDGARISITHRLRKSTGSWVWVRASIYAKEEDGALMLYVNFIDLSRDLEQKIITNALLDSLLGVVIYKVTDDKVITQYYSESIEKLSGYSSSEPQQQVQENILFELSIYPPDKTRVINQFHQFAKEKKPAKFTYRSFKKNRAIQWLSVSGTLIREEDGFPVYYCVLTLPPAESSLYQGVVEDSAGAVYIIERETRNIIYINKEGRNFFGIPEDTDVTGNSILNYISTNSLLLSPEEISSLEYDHFLILHKLSRDHRYFTIRAKALNWNDIDSYIIYAVDDTQEYSKAMQREKLLNQIPVGIGIYELHHEDDIKQIYMSDGFYKLLHVNPGLHKALIGNSIMRGVHPADTESIRTLIRKLKNGADYGAAEYRNLCYSGIYLWVRLVANVVRRSEDAITAYCVYEDISEAVTARENLQKMNIMLQRQYEIEQKKHEFLEHDSIAAMVFNESQDKLVEFKLKEAIPNKPFSGMNKASCLQVLFKLIPDPDDQKHVGDFFDTDRIIALFRSGITEHNVEFRLRRVNGCLHWTRINAQITENKDTGDIISYVFASDIDTEKVKMLVSEYIISDESDFILLLSTVTKKIEVLRLRSGHECPLMRNCRIFDYKCLSEPKEYCPHRADCTAEALMDDYDTLVEKLKHQPVVIRESHIVFSGREEQIKRIQAFYLDDLKERIVISCRDITDIYQKEEQQRIQLQNALSEAKIASNAKSVFLSNMSHDIRTPMHAILNLTDIAMDELDQPEVLASDLHKIKISSTFLLGLINDILDMSRIESGRLVLNPSAYAFSEFVLYMDSITLPLCKKNGISFSWKRVDIAPCIYVDITRFNQIFYNVLSNAIKYTPAGGSVSLTISNVYTEDGMIYADFCIRDTGIGMSEEYQKKLFTAFERADEAQAYEGAGLGLAITKQIVTLMHGSISLQSKLNEGTAVIIHLPMPLATEEQIQASESRKAICTNHPQSASDSKEKYCILLAEDHPLNREITVRLLSKANYTVECAADGAEAADMFEKSEINHYAAVLMDIRMPKMDGCQATRTIRSMNRSDAKKVAIIGMSANAFDGDARECLSIGMDAYITKPIAAEKMYQILAEQIALHRTKN